ncbi:MAG: hypothetical protein Q4Q53_03470 [Methanocorpusculum sp.]|nr:hypothetical protein [Methanocorpusculum sp.]
MKSISKILAVLLLASFMAVTVGAVHIEELNTDVTDPFGHTHEFTILLVEHEELPHHAELSPFFREGLVESEEERGLDEIPESVKDWFESADNITPPNAVIVSDDKSET